MNRLVVAIGGSILAPRDPDPDTAHRIAGLIRDLASTRRVAVVVGGGYPARHAITTARPHVHDEAVLDELGIAATRLNAATLAALLGLPGARAGDLPTTTADAAAALDQDAGIIVMGGTDPGHSTDQVAAELATRVGATRLVIATNVDGVYTADPRRNPDAKRITDLTFDGLLDIVGDTTWIAAGQSGVIDGPATQIITDNQLTTAVVDGRELDALRNACTGAPFNGTLIQDP